MTDQQIAAILDAQHPNPWMPGAWYPAEYDGQKVQIKRTTGKGRNAGHHYLNIRKAITINTKTPTGEIIDTRSGWHYYRINRSDPAAKFQDVTFA